MVKGYGSTTKRNQTQLSQLPHWKGATHTYHEKQEKFNDKKFSMSQMRFNSFSNKVHWRLEQVTRGFPLKTIE